ncbi:MAG: chitinase [Acidobacteriaceae bacterium]
MRSLVSFFAFLFSASSLAWTQSPAAKTTPSGKMFAPYLFMADKNTDLPKLMKSSGARYYSLAFVQSEGCAPSWHQVGPVASEKKFMKSIKKLRAAGGDVIISFGGYEGTDIAQACGDVSSLQKAYQVVVDKYKAKYLDMDVEHFAIEDQASIDRRSQALKALAAANPGLQINYTLPASPKGLTPAAMNVLASAVKFETPIGVVNLMTMDYGMPVEDGGMGKNAVSATDGAREQLRSLGLTAKLGITPMIGVNDTAGESFTLADARTVMAYARDNRDSIGLLAFWSIGRDNGNCDGVAKPDCSGIKQKEWDFARIFGEFR